MPKNHAAVTLGRRGGKATSERKTLAARENGKKGGRLKLWSEKELWLIASVFADSAIEAEKEDDPDLTADVPVLRALSIKAQREAHRLHEAAARENGKKGGRPKKKRRGFKCVAIDHDTGTVTFEPADD